MDMQQETAKGSEMQKQDITQEQMNQLQAFLQTQPKIRVTEDGTTETGDLWRPEELKHRGGGDIVQGWWTK